MLTSNCFIESARGPTDLRLRAHVRARNPLKHSSPGRLRNSPGRRRRKQLEDDEGKAARVYHLLGALQSTCADANSTPSGPDRSSGSNYNCRPQARARAQRQSRPPRRRVKWCPNYHSLANTQTRPGPARPGTGRRPGSARFIRVPRPSVRLAGRRAPSISAVLEMRPAGRTSGASEQSRPADRFAHDAAVGCVDANCATRSNQIMTFALFVTIFVLPSGRPSGPN